MSNEIMKSSGNIQVSNQQRVEEVVGQIVLIQSIMQKTMKDGEHYGTIPGTDKPTLLKPGAEKLTATFHLAPFYKITRTDGNNGHREYEIICTLKQRETCVEWGEGVGSCTTMESRYRFRTGPVTPTGNPVPKEYWDLRGKNPLKALQLIGGEGHVAKKVDGKWEIVIRGDQIENPNIADCYNTVLKIAKKRSLVDATLTCLGASDLFNQDVEDLFEENDDSAPEQKESKKPETKPPQAKKPEAQQQNTTKADNGKATANQVVNKLVIALKGDTDRAHKVLESVIGCTYESSNQLTEEHIEKIEIIVSEIKEAANG